MDCPRCGQTTHVVSSRAKGVAVRRKRKCGKVQNGEIVGAHCGLQFQSVEVPIGFRADIEIRMTPRGFEAEIVGRRVEPEP